MTTRSPRPLPVPAQLLILLACAAAAFLVPPASGLLRVMFPAQIDELATVLTAGATTDEKREAILGRDYAFLRFVREQTPEDAVVLMTAPPAASELRPLAGKSQAWATYYLYPRRVLYLHQRDDARYRDARWLVLDGAPAVSWIDPVHRPHYVPGQLRVAAFDMEDYLARIERGEIDARFAPPGAPAGGVD